MRFLSQPREIALIFYVQVARDAGSTVSASST
jgi:hypothetical protein